MIRCDLCEERATYAHETRGVVAYGPPTLHYCRLHLLLLYIGMEADSRDD